MKSFLEKTEPPRAFLPVSVERMALRREKRAAQQRELLEKYGEDSCVICMSMNIAGADKRSALADALFINAFLELVDRLSPYRINTVLFINENTGIEAMLSVYAEPDKVKAICVALEEQTPSVRLLDIDVIDASGAKIGRKQPRKCLICNENAAVCARSRAHSVEQLQNRTRELLKQALIEHTAELVVASLVDEVHITPKPGLVDENNSGANSDMDIALFERSAAALRPYFMQIAASVVDEYRELYNNRKEVLNELVEKLRSIGLEAERAMLDATGGVNTHRGAVYTLGLLSAAYTFVMLNGVFSPSENGVDGTDEHAKNFVGDIIAAASLFAQKLGDGSKSNSNGARVRKEYGVEGPVEQAIAGFQPVMLAKTKKTEYDKICAQEDVAFAWNYALICVMEKLDDNNALKRGGREGADFVKRRAGEIKRLAEKNAGKSFPDELLRFDEELIARNISCGGAADMLAAAIFLEKTESEIKTACDLLAENRD